MCYFKHCEVVSDKRVLKKDGIVAYKTLRRSRVGFISQYKTAIWKNNRMTATGMFSIPNGRGPGIYAYKTKPRLWFNGYDGAVVKILLYGRVIQYKGYYGQNWSRR